MIAYIKVYLDDNVPKYMAGIIRCGSVISEDENGDEIRDHQELIDNTAYHSAKDLIEDVARRLKVIPDIIEIVETKIRMSILFSNRICVLLFFLVAKQLNLTAESLRDSD